MNKKIFSLLVVIAFSFILKSCSQPIDFPPIVTNYIPDTLIRDIKYLVIIPNNGCGGCISYAEDYYNKHDDSNIYYIFTNILSLKELRYKVHLRNKNTFIDTNNIVYMLYPEDMNLYPAIITLQKGKIVKENYQSIYENGFLLIKQ